MPLPSPNSLTLPRVSPRAAARRFQAPAWSVYFVLLLGTFLVAGRASLFRDPGVFWHTSFGQRILSRGGIPRVDVHSLTRGGQTWLDLQWLGECVMAAAWNWGGWDTQLLLTAVVIAVTYAWLARRFLVAGAHPFVVFAPSALVLAASSHHFHVRPHLASIGLLGVTLAILADVERCRKPLAHLAWLTPLFIVWANIHGGVLGGLATVIMVTGLWAMRAVFRRRIDLPPAPIDSLASAFAVCGLALTAALALLVTPHGWEGLVTCIEIMRMPLPNIIQEHRPLNFLRVEGVAVVLLAVSYLSLLWQAGWKQLRATWLVPLVWLPLACLRVRHAPLFAITCGVSLAEMLPGSRLAAWLGEHGLWLATPAENATDAHAETASPATAQSLRRGWTLALAPVLLVLIVQWSAVSAPLVGRGWAQPEAAGWPLSLAPELRQLAFRQKRPLRVFNQLHYGGFVIFSCPDARVFIDDRCELYGGDLLTEYAAAEASQPEHFRVWDRQRQFDVALVASGSPFDHFLSSEPGWQLHRSTPAAVLYVRQ